MSKRCINESDNELVFYLRSQIGQTVNPIGTEERILRLLHVRYHFQYRKTVFKIPHFSHFIQIWTTFGPLCPPCPPPGLNNHQQALASIHLVSTGGGCERKTLTFSSPLFTFAVGWTKPLTILCYLMRGKKQLINDNHVSLAESRMPIRWNRDGRFGSKSIRFPHPSQIGKIWDSFRSDYSTFWRVSDLKKS